MRGNSQYSELNSYEWLSERVHRGDGDGQIAAEIRSIHGPKCKCHPQAVARARRKFDLAGRGRGRLPIFAELTSKAWMEEALAHMSMSEISRQTGASVATVSEWADRHGLNKGDRSERTRAGLKKRYPKGRFGSLSGRWKGGRRIIGDYWFLHRELVAERWPDHPRLAKPGWTKCQEHVLVVEADIGRVLLPDEEVHHGPGGKLDNRRENLTLTNRSEHQKLHWREAAELRARVAQLEAENARLRGAA